jgi:hypothetical protein
MRARICIALMAASGLTFAQQPKDAITQNTGGVCSQAVVAGGNVTITCQGLDESQRQVLLKVPALLDQLLKKQVDQKALFEKLDDLLKGQNIVLQELLTLRERTAPRVLKPEDRTAVVTTLEKYKGQEYTLASVSQDEEAFEFATAINDMLASAGWKAKDLALGRLMIVGQPRTGIELSASSADNEAGLTLLNALHSRGVEINGTLQPALPVNEVRIQIFSKAR